MHVNEQQRIVLDLMLNLTSLEGSQKAFNDLSAKTGGWVDYQEMIEDTESGHSPAYVRSTANKFEFNGATGEVRVVFDRVYDDASDTTSAAVFLIDRNGNVFL